MTTYFFEYVNKTCVRYGEINVSLLLRYLSYVEPYLIGDKKGPIYESKIIFVRIREKPHFSISKRVIFP